MHMADPPAAPYAIRRSGRARRSRLTLTESGDVVVVLPLRAPEGDAADLYRRHVRWVDRHRARLERQRIELAQLPSLAAGRPLTVGGVVQVVRAKTDDERTALERNLRRVARQAIARQLSVRAPQVGVSVARIQIRDQRTRWGSASRRGTLSFNWRLILCPTHVLDYVVVHELAHLRVAGHSPSFWRLVERHYGDYRSARRWLRDHHHEIRHALN